MRKSSTRTPNFPFAASQNAERLARFREQMADYARGERLRELRDGKHLSQEKAALDIGVSSKTLRAWEHGGKIRWPNAKRLGNFYGEDPETLVSRELPDVSQNGAEPQTQLDRIEAKLDRILDAMGVEGDADEVADVVDETVRGVQTAASPPKRTAARSGTRPAA